MRPLPLFAEYRESWEVVCNVRVDPDMGIKIEDLTPRPEADNDPVRQGHKTKKPHPLPAYLCAAWSKTLACMLLARVPETPRLTAGASRGRWPAS